MYLALVYDKASNIATSDCTMRLEQCTSKLDQ